MNTSVPAAARTHPPIKRRSCMVNLRGGCGHRIGPVSSYAPHRVTPRVESATRRLELHVEERFDRRDGNVARLFAAGAAGIDTCHAVCSATTEVRSFFAEPLTDSGPSLGTALIRETPSA